MRVELSAIEIMPYPYTYLPAVAVRVVTGIEWFHLDNGHQLPPYLGYGAEVQKEIDDWYAKRRV